MIDLQKLTKTYQPIEGYPQTTTEDRKKGFAKILANILVNLDSPISESSFLDVGSNVGYFCFELAKLGATTVGLEANTRAYNIAEELIKQQTFTSLPPLFFNKDAKNTVQSFGHIDFYLLLNVFHHILRQDEEAGWRMFNHMINHGKAVFVMMRNSYPPWHLCRNQQEIGQALVHKSDATHYKALDRVHGRIIYKVWRE